MNNKRKSIENEIKKARKINKNEKYNLTLFKTEKISLTAFLKI